MRNVLAGIKNRVRRWRSATQPSVVSIETVLAEYLTTEDLAWLIETSPDRRALFSAAAGSFDIGEDVLVARLAERAGCPCVERLAPFDPALLPPEVTLETLRRFGATVVSAERAITTLVCVDPSRIGALEPYFAGIARAVASWGVVTRHLDESELLAREAQVIREQERRTRLLEVTQMALGLVVAEVESRGGSEVRFELDGESPRYLVTAEGGQTARGTLHPMLLPTMIELMSREVVSVPLPSGFSRVVRVERNGGADRMMFRWDGESPSRLGPAVVVPPPDSGENVLAFRRGEGGGGGSAPEIRRVARVLVIDDNPTFAAVLATFLERSGFTSTHYPTADAAWRALEEGAELDLIVCDLHMPGMSGLDFVRRLRATAAGELVPVIMLTSDDDIETELRLLGAGADAFVAKSADPRLLCVQIERLIAQQARRRAA
jgi:CheY-like chemotaxis protein